MNFKKTSLLLIALFATTLYSQKGDDLRANQKNKRFYSNFITKETALNQFAAEFNLSKAYSFKMIYSNTDKNGMSHEKLQQFYKGVKIEFGTAIIHSKNNNVELINGELYNANDLVLIPNISNEVAFNVAKQSVNASQYLWEDKRQADIMEYEKPKGELVVFPNVNTGEVFLAFKFDIYALKPISRQEVYIDANSGTVLFSNPIIKHANRLISKSEINDAKNRFENSIISFATGTAATKYSGNRNIETTFNGTNYVLNDLTRGNGIFTYNSERTDTYPLTDFTDNDNNWTSAEHNNPFKDDAALDAHWGAEMTYDFWNTVFNRNSYDNNGAQIKSFVHYDNVPGGNGYSNAFWNGSVMTYGDGVTKPLTSIDVCGHEIGHAICSYTANLAYQNQSGAMNEGFSDIWGACIEHFGRTGSLSGNPVAAVWLIGEDIFTNPLRSMNNPLSRGNPDTYLGTNWTTTGDEGFCTPNPNTNDSCGVHNNSGVLNHWFYILSAGKSGTNNAPSPDTYSVTGIGIDKAAEIAYLAERDYLTPNSTYMDARNATIEVVNNLYCANSPEAIAVTNAWYAVNVGEQYNAINNDVALRTIEESSLINCSLNSLTRDLTIKNQGLNAISSVSISYTIDGGAATNLTWNGTLNSCEEITYPLTISGLSRGGHVLNVTTTIVNDGRPENNTKASILLLNDEGTVGVTNPFTANSDNLISYTQGSLTALWTRGIRSTGGAMSSGVGNYVYATNLSGNYPDETKSYLVSQCYNLTNVSNPQISFKMKYDLEENWDIVYVEYSTNFGATWSVLGAQGANWYNSNRTLASSGGNDCYNCPGAQWTGTNTTNTTYTYPLDALAGQSNVIFRIVFHSDEAVNQLGVNIDDFVINGVLSNDNFDASHQVAVYPNPSSGIFNISLNNLQPTSINVYDLTGKVVYTNQQISIVNNQTTIDLSAASNGIYFLKMNVEGQNIVKRIVKK